MYKIKVQSMISPEGNPVANQFRITAKDEGIVWRECFQSYDSTIVAIDVSGDVFLDENYWNYSRTTSTYRNIFLNETTNETKAKIKSGEYKLVNLN